MCASVDHDSRVEVLAFRFPDNGAAADAYFAARDVILMRALETSVYRLARGHMTYLVLVGRDALSPQLQNTLRDKADGSEAFQLPSDIEQDLVRRRLAERIPRPL